MAPTQPITPLRQRMLDDMKLRNMACSYLEPHPGPEHRAAHGHVPLEAAVLVVPIERPIAGGGESVVAGHLEAVGHDRLGVPGQVGADAGKTRSIPGQ